MTPGTSDFAIRKEMEWEVLLSSGDSLIGGIPRWKGQKDFVGKIPRLMSHTRQRKRRGSERPRASFCPDRGADGCPTSTCVPTKCEPPPGTALSPTTPDCRPQSVHLDLMQQMEMACFSKFDLICFPFYNQVCRASLSLLHKQGY